MGALKLKLIFAGLMVSLPTDVIAGSNLNCNSVAYAGGFVALPGDVTGNISACNVMTGTCSRMSQKSGARFVRLLATGGDIISVNDEQPGGASCLIKTQPRTSPITNSLPSLIAGIIGILGALIGALFKSVLDRRRERDLALTRWRMEMIERLEDIVVTGKAMPILTYPREVDQKTFAAICKIKVQVEDDVGSLPLNAAPADRISLALNALEILKPKGPVRSKSG